MSKPFDAHELPWKEGESNESKAIVLDNRGNTVCVIRESQWGYAESIREILLKAVNNEQARTTRSA